MRAVVPVSRLKARSGEYVRVIWGHIDLCCHPVSCRVCSSELREVCRCFLLVELPCVSLLRLSSAVSCYCDGSTLPGCLLCVFKPSRCFFSVSLLFALFSCVLGRFYAPALRRLFVVSLSPVQRLRFMALVSFWKLLWCKSFFPTELPSCHDKQRSRKLSHVSSSD